MSLLVLTKRQASKPWSLMYDKYRSDRHFLAQFYSLVIIIYSPSFIMRPQILFVLIASILFAQSHASNEAVGSFYTLSGPVVLSLNRGSGELSYNIYGQNGYSAMQSITPAIAPRNDTAVAVTGYQVTQSIYVRYYCLALTQPKLIIDRHRYSISLSTTVSCNKPSSVITCPEFARVTM